MVYRKCLIVLFVLLFAGFTISAAEKDNEIRVPDWLSSDEPVSREQVQEEDYPYLVRWLDNHAQPAQ